MGNLPILYCAICETDRVPLIEDGSCGWCGKAKWYGSKPTEPEWPDLSRPPVTPQHRRRFSPRRPAHAPGGSR